MKTILYATDYSEESIAAFHWANLIKKKYEAKLIVVHVFNDPVSLASPVSITYLKKEKSKFLEHGAKLKNFCKKHLGHELDNLDIKIMVDENNSVSDGILEKAIKLGANLIVLGTKGASKGIEFLFGSTTKALIRKSSCPVLAVPSKSKISSIGRIVYTTDFEQADIFALNRLIDIAKKFNAEIRVVHITTKNEYAGEEQMNWFQEMLLEKVVYPKLEFELIFSDEILEELSSYVEDSEADLLVMLERKEDSFYQKYLQKDMVKRMVKNIEVPLLSFNVGGL